MLIVSKKVYTQLCIPIAYLPTCHELKFAWMYSPHKNPFEVGIMQAQSNNKNPIIFEWKKSCSKSNISWHHIISLL